MYTVAIVDIALNGNCLFAFNPLAIRRFPRFYVQIRAARSFSKIFHVSRYACGPSIELIKRTWVRSNDLCVTRSFVKYRFLYLFVLHKYLYIFILNSNFLSSYLTFHRELLEREIFNEPLFIFLLRGLSNSRSVTSKKLRCIWNAETLELD